MGANGPGRRTRVPRQRTASVELLRFAFYGRDSTEDYQDRLSSSRWQRDFAEDLIAGHGRITVGFFDSGVSRRIRWSERPQASRLLAALASPDRGFDAIVVGEFERAFYADQYTQLAPVFAAHGVQLWLPELDGPVDSANELHMSLLALLGSLPLPASAYKVATSLGRPPAAQCSAARYSTTFGSSPNTSP